MFSCAKFVLKIAFSRKSSQVSQVSQVQDVDFRYHELLSVLIHNTQSATEICTVYKISLLLHLGYTTMDYSAIPIIKPPMKKEI